MRSRDVSILIIPGLGNSGPDHWQSRWQAKLPTARRVEQASWDRPMRGPWLAAITAAIADAEKRVVLVAHSLGVVAAVEALLGVGDVPVVGAFLVAPPAEESILKIPEIDPAFAPYPTAPLPCPSVVVGSRNDPYARTEQVESLALDWGARFIDAGEAGHLNADSGHGPWPEGLMAFAGFLSKL